MLPAESFAFLEYLAPRLRILSKGRECHLSSNNMVQILRLQPHWPWMTMIFKSNTLDLWQIVGGILWALLRCLSPTPNGLFLSLNIGLLTEVLEIACLLIWFHVVYHKGQKAISSSLQFPWETFFGRGSLALGRREVRSCTMRPHYSVSIMCPHLFEA